MNIINGDFPSGKKDFVIIAILLAAISVAFFSPTVFKGLYPYQRDITYIFQPQQAFSNQFIQGGYLPLWNSYSYMGMPFLANWQSRVFNPLTMMFYFFGSTCGMRIFYPLVMFLGGFFAFCFFRYKNFGFTASLVGALVWMLGGYFTTKLEFFSYASTLAFTFAPLIFVAYPVMGGISLALAFLGGYPVFFLITLIYAIFILASEGMSLFIRMKILGLALIVFVVLVMVQLLPTVELAIRTNLSFTGGYHPDVMSANSILIGDILNFLFPYYSRSVNNDIVGVLPHWLKNFYIGIFGCVLLFTGIAVILFDKKEQRLTRLERSLWGGLFISGFFLSFEVVYKTLAQNGLGVLRFFRYPSTMIFFSAMASAVLCAYGSDWIFRRKKSWAGIVIALCIAGELFIRGFIIRNNSGYTTKDYFYETPPAVEFLRKDMSEGSCIARFALAPKTLKISMLKGADILDGWRTARYLLKGFVALPYRLMNIYGFGEPLVPYYSELLVDKVYSAQTPDKAADLYKKVLGVKYLLSAAKFNESIVKRYEPLLMPQNSRCYIYRIRDDAFVFDITDGKSHSPLSPTNGLSQDKLVFETPEISGGDKNYFFRASCGGWHYPGWKVYVKGKKSEIKVGEDFTLNIPLMSSVKNEFNTHKIILLYSPLSFLSGVGFSLIAVGWICAFYTSRLLRILRCQG